MDTHASKSQLGKANMGDLSVRIKHRPSNLDLLDNKTLTSFPLPDTFSGNHSITNNSINETKYITSEYDSGKRVRRGQSNNILSEFKTYSPKHEKKSPLLHSMTASSSQTSYCTEHEERIKSMNNSIMSKNITNSSKRTSPPSSLDYQSSLYDYRLVLQQSEKKMDTMRQEHKNSQKYSNTTDYKISDNINETLKTENTGNIYNTSNTDLYIQSLYNDLFSKEETSPVLQCLNCNSPTIKIENTSIHSKGIICQNCFHNKDTLIYCNDNVKEVNLADVHDDLFSISPPTDIAASSMNDETCNTIQILMDTTIMSDGEDTTDYGIFQNIDFLHDDTDNRFKRNIDNFEKIIRKLRRIERTDLQIRQSIADLRGATYTANNRNSSIWSSIKRRFGRT